MLSKRCEDEYVLCLVRTSDSCGEGVGKLLHIFSFSLGLILLSSEDDLNRTLKLQCVLHLRNIRFHTFWLINFYDLSSHCEHGMNLFKILFLISLNILINNKLFNVKNIIYILFKGLGLSSLSPRLQNIFKITVFYYIFLWCQWSFRNHCNMVLYLAFNKYFLLTMNVENSFCCLMLYFCGNWYTTLLHDQNWQ